LTTVIRATLDQTVISDYVGPLRLLVVDDVYDVERHQVLIPKGSKVLAHSLLVGNINAPIQSRMGITVERMVLPNGQSIDFSRQAALDREGIAAVEGSTDYHLLEQFLGVAAYALLSAGTSRQGSGIANDSTFTGDLGASARQQFQPLVARYLSLVPTITLSPGTPMRIFLQEEMWITPWKPVGHRFVAGRS
jgi:type IV secretion system protein VirB10